jgi:potassium channel LctB
VVSKKVLLSNLFSLFLIYLNIVITFALLYMFVEAFHLGRLIDHFAGATPQSTLHGYLTRSVYFSAITLLGVGYGDVTPFGLSRAIAVIEAMIGYILPAALVIGYTLFPARYTTKVRVRKH